MHNYTLGMEGISNMNGLFNNKLRKKEADFVLL